VASSGFGKDARESILGTLMSVEWVHRAPALAWLSIAGQRAYRWGMSTRPGPSPRQAAEPARPEDRGQAGGAVPAIALRPATPADDEFCYQLHKAAMGGYIAATWGWDEQAQRRSHARKFSPRWQIITVGGADAGMLDVERRPGEIYLSRIEMHPRHQGQGIGTRLIGALIDEAARHGQDLVLDVLTVNDRAQALYRRLGLTEVARHGDNNVKITMRLRPPGAR
jgi:GNAT superfamily N-acetyltransferase